MIPWRDVIEFERTGPDGDARPRAIRERFGVSPTRYYQELDRILELPHVQVAAPDVVGRLKRNRSRRRTLRFARRIQDLPSEERGGVAGQEALPLGGPPPQARPPVREVLGRLGAAIGTAARDLGIARVDEATPAEWRDRADFEIRMRAMTGEEFTAQEIRAVVGDPPGHPNAMGARFMAAARAGLIRKVDYRPSDRPSLHRHHIAVWIGTEADHSTQPSPEEATA